MLTVTSLVSEQRPLDRYPSYVHHSRYVAGKLTLSFSPCGLQLVRRGRVHFRFVAHFGQDLPCDIALHAAPVPSGHV